MESCLITINDLKKYTNIGENVDILLLEPHLLLSQQMYFFDVVGEALYSDLVYRFDNNQISGDTENLLNNYCTQAIGFGAWFSAYPFLAYHTQRSGISTMTSDVLTPATVEEISLYGSKVCGLKDFYLNRLQSFLDDNIILFPLYRRDTTQLSQGSPLYLGFKNRTAPSNYWGI